jgi:hypothetical protein
VPEIKSAPNNNSHPSSGASSHSVGYHDVGAMTREDAVPFLLKEAAPVFVGRSRTSFCSVIEQKP